MSNISEEEKEEEEENITQEKIHVDNVLKPLPSFPSKLHEWSCEDVCSWLQQSHFEEIIIEAFFENKVDGPVLASLTQEDLRDHRFGLKTISEVYKVFWAIEKLHSYFGTLNILPKQDSENERRHSIANFPEQTNFDKGVKVVKRKKKKKKKPKEKEGSVSLKKIMKEVPDLYDWLTSKPSWWPFGQTQHFETRHTWKRMESWGSAVSKLAISFLFVLFVALLTAFVMTIVHERVPPSTSYPPLPDIFLDSIPHIPIAFTIAEINILIEAIIFIIILLLHRHRVVILRRFFAIVGVVFLLRCATMFVTSLSVPGKHLHCEPLHKNATIDDVVIQEAFERAWEIFRGLGMSINGVRTCGDYMFSGHTSILTLLNFFILEYSSKKWRGLQIISWVFNLFGMFFILAAHEHYSIDVFMAYYISSHLFLNYHNLANSLHLFEDERGKLKGAPTSFFPLFYYLEEHTKGTIPNEYIITSLNNNKNK